MNIMELLKMPASGIEGLEEIEQEAAKEKLIGLSGLISKHVKDSETRITNQLQEVREYRKAARNSLKKLKEFERAHRYLVFSRNPLPFLKMLGSRYASNFCDAAGIRFSEEACKIPDDFK